MNTMNTMKSIIKVCLIGDADVGKSSIIYKLHHDDLIELNKQSTIGASFLSLKVKINDKLLNFHLWDTAGQERFNSIVPLYFRGTNIYMVVFDLTDIKSWQNVSECWIPMIQKHQKDNDKYGVVIVGNKMDKDMCVHKKDIRKFCELNNLEYIMISAKCQTTQEIMDQCILKSFKSFMKRYPLIFEEKSIKLSKNTRKNKCSNAMECN